MKTQRVNVYISGSDLNVFYIEQYNPELREWFNVGGTYEKIEHATAQAELFNMREVYAELTKLRAEA